ncbi:hypothetical protein GOV13_04160 [Candidatus Pacearchaeota archaeon]|nr:hypothetical protein [Candidatus Pacearchaeota archaeon]
MKSPRSFDVLGNIAIVNFPLDFKLKDKKAFVQRLLKEHSNIKTVLEKIGKVKGRLRKPETKHLAGEKTKEVLYRENDCVFRFNIDRTYFSPRLSNERKEIASMIKRNDDVLVMFAGVAPFSIVIAKKSRAKRVVSNEINKEANKYAKLNVDLNKVKDKVELVQGDVKRVIGSLGSQLMAPKSRPADFSAKKLLSKKVPQSYDKQSKFVGFDVIVMPRPQLKDSFLEQAFRLSKKGTRIYYYDFCRVDEINLIVEKIKDEAKKFKKKIKILKTKKAGEIAPYKIRLRVDFRVV